jgi:hypothetical protein
MKKAVEDGGGNGAVAVKDTGRAEGFVGGELMEPRRSAGNLEGADPVIGE